MDTAYHLYLFEKKNPKPIRSYYLFMFFSLICITKNSLLKIKHLFFKLKNPISFRLTHKSMLITLLLTKIPSFRIKKASLKA